MPQAFTMYKIDSPSLARLFIGKIQILLFSTDFPDNCQLISFGNSHDPLPAAMNHIFWNKYFRSKDMSIQCPVRFRTSRSVYNGQDLPFL